jgi:cytoskeletal protein CcmA (bactofilin family)
MWRKAEDSKLNSSPGALPSPVSSAQRPDAWAPENSPSPPVAVSQGIKIKGEISGHGDLFLDGEFEGKIRLTSGTFTVGPNARVSAEIEASEIIVRGEVLGTLKACERVHIWSTGKLTGDIETRGIVIEDGAVMHSRVAVPQAAVDEAAVPEVSVSKIDQPSEPSSPEPLSLAKGAAGAP